VPAGHVPGSRWGPLGAACVLRPWAERLLDAVRPRSGERILDCPSDSGTLSRRLGRAVGGGGLVVTAEPQWPGPAFAAAAVGPEGAPLAASALRVEPGRLPLASGSLDAAVSLLTVHLVPDPAALLAEMLRAVDPRRGRVAVVVQLGDGGSPHEGAVAAVLGGGAPPAPVVAAGAVAGLLQDVAGLAGERRAPLRDERWRDVVRFDGVDQLWAALVTERGLDAGLTPARRAALEASLGRWMAADGTLRIPAQALVLRLDGIPW
jgi:SAM-dependent methyltransferase